MCIRDRYAGPRYTYFNSRTTFAGQMASELKAGDVTRRVGKRGLVVDYDGRDNMFYPTQGAYAELEAQFARPSFGSSQSFNTYGARGYVWQPLAPRWTLGLRLDSQLTSGSVPFYAQPYVDLRGVSRGRYPVSYTHLVRRRACRPACGRRRPAPPGRAGTSRRA